MKYLIKYKGRFAIAIGVCGGTLYNIIRAIRTGNLTEEMIEAFALAVFTLLGLYYNMPTSVEGDTGTKTTIEMKEIEEALKAIEYEAAEEPEDATIEGDDDDCEE